jgi:hypothetical protein
LDDPSARTRIRWISRKGTVSESAKADKGDPNKKVIPAGTLSVIADTLSGSSETAIASASSRFVMRMYFTSSTSKSLPLESGVCPNVATVINVVGSIFRTIREYSTKDEFTVFLNEEPRSEPAKVMDSESVYVNGAAVTVVAISNSYKIYPIREYDQRHTPASTFLMK